LPIQAGRERPSGIAWKADDPEHEVSDRAMDARRPVLSLFGRRERKEAFDELQALTVDIAKQLDQHAAAVVEPAFRYAMQPRG
jgi:hypothetical protein